MLRSRKIVFVFLKTGNSPKSIIEKVKEEGFIYVSRKQVSTILNHHKIDIAIYNDFNEFPNEIEQKKLSYTSGDMQKRQQKFLHVVRG